MNQSSINHHHHQSIIINIIIIIMMSLSSLSSSSSSSLSLMIAIVQLIEKKKALLSLDRFSLSPLFLNSLQFCSTTIFLLIYLLLYPSHYTSFSSYMIKLAL
ncbi:hypothetical protein WUBG_12082 [Wuchereria bancrofti]|uniref:Uncharacterized protein n=1 Tax=Wuchereria bancrofti TaxID=6293 RepID=J9E4C7_WUCBA|nr:hypothetical protein WUBG_12082 [Wuchereria bancrofti]